MHLNPLAKLCVFMASKIVDLGPKPFPRYCIGGVNFVITCIPMARATSGREKFWRKFVCKFDVKNQELHPKLFVNDVVSP